MEKTRHVGGSLLPSNNSRILQPMGKLQVRVLPELDTHGLFFTHEQGEMLIAIHPNGFSCYELAERMSAGVDNAQRAIDQAQYILNCGGLTININHIRNIMYQL